MYSVLTLQSHRALDLHLEPAPQQLPPTSRINVNQGLLDVEREGGADVIEVEKKAAEEEEEQSPTYSREC